MLRIRLSYSRSALLLLAVLVGMTGCKNQSEPARQAILDIQTIVDKVADPGRSHLTRAIFIREDVAPFLGIEDALGTLPDIGQLPAGQVFRIEYGRDGVVKVSYLTGDDDERGRRDPYQLRENERWAAIYNQYL